MRAAKAHKRTCPCPLPVTPILHSEVNMDRSISNLMRSGNSGSPSKVPALKVECADIREVSVTNEFEFEGETCLAKDTANSVNYALTDGTDTIKAILKEDSGATKKMVKGRTYILRNYGFQTSRGNISALIFINKGTSVMATAAVEVSSAVRATANILLRPASREVTLVEAKTAVGLVTVSGTVTSANSPRKVQVRGKFVPVRDVRMSDGEVELNLSLWRDNALTDFSTGDGITVSHLNRGAPSTVYGIQMNTTNYTSIMITPATESTSVYLVDALEKTASGRFCWSIDGLEETYTSSSEVVIRWLGEEPSEDWVVDNLPMQALLTVRAHVVTNARTHNE